MVADRVYTADKPCALVLDSAVTEESKHSQSPFTMNPTASLVLEKEKQIKERAHPPGTSKILGQARAKAEESAKKVRTLRMNKGVVVVA